MLPIAKEEPYHLLKNVRSKLYKNTVANFEIIIDNVVNVMRVYSEMTTNYDMWGRREYVISQRV